MQVNVRQAGLSRELLKRNKRLLSLDFETILSFSNTYKEHGKVKYTQRI